MGRAGQRAAAAAWLAASATLAVSACGTAAPSGTPASPTTTSDAPAPDQRPVPAGRGTRYRLPATSKAVARRARVAGLKCSSRRRPFYGVHLELYAHGLVVPVPAGIGIAPPLRRAGAYVLGGACSYPIRTFEPTGVVVVDRRDAPTLGELFALWGQSLSRRALAGFRGRVLAFVGGRRWTGSPGAIPLRRHTEIVLEIAGALAPHRTYRFPPGL